MAALMRRPPLLHQETSQNHEKVMNLNQNSAQLCPNWLQTFRGSPSQDFGKAAVPKQGPQNGLILGPPPLFCDRRPQKWCRFLAPILVPQIEPKNDTKWNTLYAICAPFVHPHNTESHQDTCNRPPFRAHHQDCETQTSDVVPLPAHLLLPVSLQSPVSCAIGET
jgi:hypothetical protein